MGQPRLGRNWKRWTLYWLAPAGAAEEPGRLGRNWKRWTFYGVLAVGAVVGSGYFLIRDASLVEADVQETKAAAEHPSSVRVEVIHPQKGGMDRTTVQPGTVQAFESVQLYAGVPGYLKTLNVDIGDRVQRGQVLAKVDVPELEKQVQRHASALEQARARVLQMKARVASTRADLEAAKAAVVQAEATVKSRVAELRFRQQQLQRMKDLFALKSIDERMVDEKTEQRDAAQETVQSAEAAVLTSKAQVNAALAKIQQAEADVVEAEADVKVAQAELEKAQVLVQFATIVAPFDGVIIQRSLFPGDFVRAATEGGTHTPLLTVHRTDRMRVVVQIPDRDVPYCDPGDPAVVEIDALPGKKFPAKVSRIAQFEDPDTRLMHVELDLPNPTGKLCHGMYGRVTILLDKSDLFAIPPSCLVGKPQDGKGNVFVVRNGHAHLTPVQLAADNGLLVGIHSGLKAEDEVILHPDNGVVDSAPVLVSSRIK